MTDNVREIPLSQGKVALVDECDYERVSQFKWYADKSRDGKRWYGRRNIHSEETGRRTTQLLHKFILNECGKFDVDHRDGDGLNCQRSNLRNATRSQNNVNSGIQRNNTSGFKGVYWGKSVNKWIAEIMVDYKKHYLGCFLTAEDAARAYDKMAKSLFGEFAKLNFNDEESGSEPVS